MKKTIRLLMPQWQGGNNPPYAFGAKLLAWLAPDNKDIPQIEVPVEPYTGMDLPVDNGVVGREVLLQQLEAATKIIEANHPDKIIVFGGDCLVSQAPFTYLNKKYNGRLGVLWLDAHPDISTPEMHNHEHAMVLGNLLGAGDPVFASKVEERINPRLVMYGGLQEMTPAEEKEVARLGLTKSQADTKGLSESSEMILQWIRDNKIEHLAIHLDLDVLDPKQFRALLPCNPAGGENYGSLGGMTFNQIGRIIDDVNSKTEIVGLSIAEHLPWDAINLHNFLSKLPVFG